MNYTEKLLFQMFEFDRGDSRRIQHFLKVWEYARLIGQLEKIPENEQKILEAAAILHDIGIIPCEKTFGRCDGKMQEKYGPEYAMILLNENGAYSLDEMERICFLIGHHHNYECVDGVDYQILLEADFLVNACEDSMDMVTIINVRNRIFKTKTGTDILNTTYNLYVN